MNLDPGNPNWEFLAMIRSGSPPTLSRLFSYYYYYYSPPFFSFFFSFYIPFRNVEKCRARRRHFPPRPQGVPEQHRVQAASRVGRGRGSSDNRVREKAPPEQEGDSAEGGGRDQRAQQRPDGGARAEGQGGSHQIFGESNFPFRLRVRRDLQQRDRVQVHGETAGPDHLRGRDGHLFRLRSDGKRENPHDGRRF